ncbi:Glu-tRNA(Gln) amidotransferase GatDE subunit D [Candidatus Micrarchaeota archaeon CG_4_10_14_0_2_um_filter_55_9]|nr:MAG: glutamyl-tRNA(Gln) amidotransferase subunit D [Candidatus Micrarchaeota archaeon CG1_02_55_41]PIO02949.1 MAG: Glu-tRNA(Gln) amidotransferase GatDE subunit D [Candidatus Micrarchaeota archaeon CG09_land_8_20_14_0_10_55_25]PIZ92004.1 MAG: Glu-tRNA(Gln) amidotransferase GatDE subunit D [Candidatus Micrarchaeota archaeon CG_4_10_14_0_2_um_filter_55_9]PJD01330.1 MAG: Glu-tRNA(Gln) amidotransferase GatDE subunit D [Candidatus Micrarchaeota archaeon CG10_big_fil_rev_8_21_14_0_10_54_18]
MYSKRVQKLLANANPGDRVNVNGEYEGVLMPRTQGDADAVILKLDSGYNVGVKPEKIRKLKGGVALENFAAKKIKKKSGLPNLAFIATGGTIASRVDYETGGVKMVLTPAELFAVVPELEGKANFSVSAPFTLASEDITPKDWVKLAEECVKKLNSGAEGVILTHGTDTLGYTAAALSFMVDSPKPIALVGAQRSSDRGSFDGALNLSCATQYALSESREVAVVMHASYDDDYCFAHRGTKVRKMHSTRRDAFKSVNDSPLARVYPDKTEFLQEVRKRGAGDAVSRAAFQEKTGFVKVYPGIDPEHLEWFVDKGYKGVVIEAFALGHVPTLTTNKKKSWLKVMERATREMPVAFATQCIFGRVNPNVYRNLRVMKELGVIYCEDMLPETAFVKMGWLLGRGEDPREKMLENVAGELNSRLTEKHFI